MSYEYNPKSNVVFGDVDLSNYNAYAVYCNIFDRPERDVSVVSVPGRNGDLIFDNGRYKNVDRIYQIQVVGVENVHGLIRDLISTVGYQRLEDEYDPNVYMMARLKGKPVVKRFVGNAVLLTVTFDRMPQKWDKDEGAGEMENTYIMFHYTPKSGIVHTHATRYALAFSNTKEVTNPIIKLHGSIVTNNNDPTVLELEIFIKDTKSTTYNYNGVYDTSGKYVRETDFYDIKYYNDYSYLKTPKTDIFTMKLLFDDRDGYTENKNYNIVIDSENKIIYDDDTKENLNDCINDFVKFPEIKPGRNDIYVMDKTSPSGNLTSYDVNVKKWSL